MSVSDRQARKSGSGIDYRLLLPLMMNGFFVQILTGLCRITTSYRILELDLPIVWLGVTAATFALLPIFLAVSVGRYIDRGHDARAAHIGSALMLAAAVGLRFFAPTPVLILVFTALFGVSHLFLMASQQMLCVRAAGDHSRDSVFGNFLMITGIGQGMGPFIVGWIGGSARVPDTTLLFSIAVGVGLAALCCALALRPAGESAVHHHKSADMTVGKLLRIQGFVVVLAASVITMSAQDLITVYLPLLGAERGIGVGDIGLMLTVRSIAAVISRLGYAQLVSIVGRVPLTFASMMLSGMAFCALALPVPVLVLHVACAVLGIGLGIATTLSLTSVVELAPVAVRATALSLRITGNRLGQASMPFLGSLLASATGAAGVLFVTGLSLAISGVAVHIARSGRE